MEGRFERKYKINGIEPQTVQANLMLHPAGFRVLYPDRRVNNIYFDTVDMATFRQNVDGVNQRKKFRLRWYGEQINTIEKPQFEIKIKHNELGTKEVTPFEDTGLEEMKILTKRVNEKSGSFAPLFPVLLNSYLRSYYISADGRFRVTIDRVLRYYSLLATSRFLGFTIEEQGVILEIKYDKDNEQYADLVMQNMPYRNTKSSKYVNGVVLTSGV